MVYSLFHIVWTREDFGTNAARGGDYSITVDGTARVCGDALSTYSKTQMECFTLYSAVYCAMSYYKGGTKRNCFAIQGAASLYSIPMSSIQYTKDCGHTSHGTGACHTIALMAFHVASCSQPLLQQFATHMQHARAWCCRRRNRSNVVGMHFLYRHHPGSFPYFSNVPSSSFIQNPGGKSCTSSHLV